MRIKLFKGKQRELINLAKRGRTWFQLSSELGLNDVYIRNELRNEQRLLPKSVYKKLCKLVGRCFNDYITEEFEDNWGNVMGGRLSSGNTKKIRHPKETKEFAETRITVGVFSYNEGQKKLQISRENMNANEEWRFAKLGRMTKDEVQEVVPIIAKGDTICLNELNQAVLEVTNAQQGIIYNWYIDKNSDSIIYTGETININNITSEQTYFVQAYASNDCIDTTKVEVNIVKGLTPVSDFIIKTAEPSPLSETVPSAYCKITCVFDMLS